MVSVANQEHYLTLLDIFMRVAFSRAIKPNDTTATCISFCPHFASKVGTAFHEAGQPVAKRCWLQMLHSRLRKISFLAHASFLESFFEEVEETDGLKVCHQPLLAFWIESSEVLTSNVYHEFIDNPEPHVSYAVSSL